MICQIKNNTVYKFLRRIFRFFFPYKIVDKKQEDYEYLISHGVDTEYGYVTLYGKPLIKKVSNSRIVIGKGVVLVSENYVDGHVINEAGVNHPVILSTSYEGAEIIIHDHVGISGSSIVACKKVEIGECTNLGVNSCIYDTDFHCVDPLKRKHQRSIIEAKSSPVKLGNNVWLGANSIVLKGVTIGNNSIVGAMSLVTHNVDENTIVGEKKKKTIKQL